MKRNDWINLVAALVALVILALYLLNLITGEQTAFAFTVALPYALHLLNERRKKQSSHKLNPKIPEDENKRI